MFNTIRHLLPNAEAWRLTVNKQLRRFIQGLGGVGDDARSFADLVWFDIFPQTTREVSQWERQWGLLNTLTDEQERRDRLDATWKALGGQSPGYIQGTLQAAGFNVYVHEWWVPGTTIPRDPNTYLSDDPDYLTIDGAADMQDGDALAQDGGFAGPSGYPLVNKLLVPSQFTIGDGAADMQDGGMIAMDGGILTSYHLKQYAIPSNPAVYPYFLYIGGATFPDKATIDAARRNEFESLCLKICPTQQWLGILVNYA